MLLYVLQGLVLGLSAAATPGPFQAFLLSRTAQQGWRRAMPAAFSPLLSDGPIIVLVVLMLTQIPGLLLEALRFGGGLFLLYLALQALRAARLKTSPQPSVQAPAAGSILQAAILNLLNPNPYIFWSLIGGPILLQCWQLSAGCCAAFLGGMYFALIGGCACLIILFAAATRLGQKVNRAMLYASAIALALFACYQLGRTILTLTQRIV